MSGESLKGKGLVKGASQGAALPSLKAFTFAHGVNPETGEVTDVRSDIRGTNVKGRILFYPFGKGSTTASSWFLETVRLGNHPAGIVTEGVDLSAVIGSTMAQLLYEKTIPVISGIPRAAYSKLRPGTEVRLDGTSGEVVVRP